MGSVTYRGVRVPVVGLLAASFFVVLFFRWLSCSTVAPHVTPCVIQNQDRLPLKRSTTSMTAFYGRATADAFLKNHAVDQMAQFKPKEPRLKGKSVRGAYAFALYSVPNQEDFVTTAVAIRSLLATKPKWDVLLLSSPAWKPFEALFRNIMGVTIVIYRDPFYGTCELSKSTERLRYSHTKFYLWGLEEYDFIHYIDYDTIIMQNMDHVGDDFVKDGSLQILMGQRSAECVHNGPMTGRFNSGVFLLRPNVDTMNAFFSIALHSDSCPTGEQDVFITVFEKGNQDLFRCLSSPYNCISKKTPDCYLIHFAGSHVKPWRSSLSNIRDSFSVGKSNCASYVLWNRLAHDVRDELSLFYWGA